MIVDNTDSEGIDNKNNGGIDNTDSGECNPEMDVVNEDSAATLGECNADATPQIVLSHLEVTEVEDSQLEATACCGKFASNHGSPCPSNASSRCSSMGKRKEDPEISENTVRNLPGEHTIKLEEEIGQGTFGLVWRGVSSTDGRQVAVKIVENMEENMEEILQEYKILLHHSLHPNIPMLFGAYRCDNNIWFSMELCSGGSAAELCTRLKQRGKKLNFDQIAYIIKEVLHALIYLQERNCIHRDVKGSNILFTDEADVKLVDFGIACQMMFEEEKHSSRVGTPYWMAPEVITCDENSSFYDGRCDVWSLGITMIELAEGSPPLFDLHPMRALFQIPRNPPPSLASPEDWGVALNDCITECLNKNPIERPILKEVIQHPLFLTIPQNPTYIQHGLSMLLKWVLKNKDPIKHEAEVSIRQDVIIHSRCEEKDKTDATKTKTLPTKKSKIDGDLIKIENLAHCQHADSPRKIENILTRRQRSNNPYSYMGDILVCLNPEKENSTSKMKEMQNKFPGDNDPHIFALADAAYQQMRHLKKNRTIVSCGPRDSGKHNTYFGTINMLIYLGTPEGWKIGAKIQSGDGVLHQLTEMSGERGGATARFTQLYFNNSGYITGAKFSNSMMQVITNFRQDMDKITIFQRMLAGLTENGFADLYHLHHLKGTTITDSQKEKCVQYYNTFVEDLKHIGFRPQTGIDIIQRVLVSIILLTKLEFGERAVNKSTVTHITNEEVLESIATLLCINEQDISRSLTTNQLSWDGNTHNKNNTPEEASKAAWSLASGLYSRLLDWVEDFTNLQMGTGLRAYGVNASIGIIDIPGTYREDTGDDFGRLLVNTANENLHWLMQMMLMRWEEAEARNNQIEAEYPSHIPDFRTTLDNILSKTGFLRGLNAATQKDNSSNNREGNAERISFQNSPYCSKEEGTLKVHHFWGRSSYNLENFFTRNRNFLHPSLIQTMRGSSDDIIRLLFKLTLDKFGKLNFGRLENEDFINAGFCQMTSQQSLSSQFMCWLSETIKTVLSNNPHFMLCFNSSNYLSRQLEAYNVPQITFIQKHGYPYRFTFAEFLRRYCFLGFEYDERVLATRESCQILLIRLKFDGFKIGRKKLFLKYYHIHFLEKMYEVQHMRVVKIQSAIRRFLGMKQAEKQRCRKIANTYLLVKKLAIKWKVYKQGLGMLTKQTVANLSDKKYNTIQKNEAATEIQRYFRGFSTRKKFKLQRTLTMSMDDEESNAIGEIATAIQLDESNSIAKFSEKVHLNNASCYTFLKNNSFEEPTENIEPLPYNMPRLTDEDLERLKSWKHKSSTNEIQKKIYKIDKFYNNEGPFENWDDLVEEESYKITGCQNISQMHEGQPPAESQIYLTPDFVYSNTGIYEKSPNHSSASSINNRTPKYSLSKNKSIPGSLKTVRSPIPSKMPTPQPSKAPSLVSSRVPSRAGSQVLSRKDSPVASMKLSQTSMKRSPVVSPPTLITSSRPSSLSLSKPYQLKSPNETVIEQLNKMKKCPKDKNDDEGPFDFKSLLRKTDFIPTDTWKKRRSENHPSITYVFNQGIKETCTLAFGKEEIIM